MGLVGRAQGKRTRRIASNSHQQFGCYSPLADAKMSEIRFVLTAQLCAVASKLDSPVLFCYLLEFLDQILRAFETKDAIDFMT
jgi:hypothetical protein